MSGFTSRVGRSIPVPVAFQYERLMSALTRVSYGVRVLFAVLVVAVALSLIACDDPPAVQDGAAPAPQFQAVPLGGQGQSQKNADAFNSNPTLRALFGEAQSDGR
jgi:hypothetical protein